MIEIHIPKDAVPAKFEDNDIQFGQIVLDKLRAAGVPAIGQVFLRGVETGRLEMECDDLASDDYIFRYFPP